MRKQGPTWLRRLKWSGAVLTALLAALWTASLWWELSGQLDTPTSTRTVGIRCGSVTALNLNFQTPQEQVRPIRVELRPLRARGPVSGWPTWQDRRNGGWQLLFPLWVPGLFVAAPTAVCWWLDRGARRRRGTQQVAKPDRPPEGSPEPKGGLRAWAAALRAVGVRAALCLSTGAGLGIAAALLLSGRHLGVGRGSILVHRGAELAGWPAKPPPSWTSPNLRTELRWLGEVQVSAFEDAKFGADPTAGFAYTGQKSMEYESLGWPFIALISTRLRPSGSLASFGSRADGVYFDSWPVGAVRVGSVNGEKVVRCWPVMPDPLGLCLDAAFFGSIVFLVTETALWGRVVVRKARRTCAACAYSLVGLPEGRPCPECGTPWTRTKLLGVLAWPAHRAIGSVALVVFGLALWQTSGRVAPGPMPPGNIASVWGVSLDDSLPALPGGLVIVKAAPTPGLELSGDLIVRGRFQQSMVVATPGASTPASRVSSRRLLPPRDGVLLWVDVSANTPASVAGREVGLPDQQKAPAVLSSYGTSYPAVGYCYSDAQKMILRYTPEAPIGSLAEIASEGAGLTSGGLDQRLYLLFAPARRAILRSVNIGPRALFEFPQPIEADPLR